MKMGFPGGSVGEESSGNAGEPGSLGGVWQFRLHSLTVARLYSHSLMWIISVETIFSFLVNMVQMHDCKLGDRQLLRHYARGHSVVSRFSFMKQLW